MYLNFVNSATRVSLRCLGFMQHGIKHNLQGNFVSFKWYIMITTCNLQSKRFSVREYILPVFSSLKSMLTSRI